MNAMNDIGNARRLLGPHEAAQREVVRFDNPAAYAYFKHATALVFEDPRSRALHERLRRIAPSNATVLIIGETGTGKELAARELHRLSARAAGPFVAINCAALPEQLVESELFGHERGAFTGAVLQKKGWFEAAHGGTLFLDEIGDLPPTTQVKLLRVLQEREINRVGSRISIPIDVRLVGATNMNLEAAVRAGRFREDLYYRLNVAPLRLSPLRERPGDILPLCEHFVAMYRERLALDRASLAQATKAALVSYPWPGNIRELENVIHHALLVMSDGVVQPQDLNLAHFNFAPEPELPAPSDIANAGAPLERALLALFESGSDELFANIEARVIRCAFEYCQRNQLQTARLLGISRNILRHRLKLYGLL